MTADRTRHAVPKASRAGPRAPEAGPPVERCRNRCSARSVVEEFDEQLLLVTVLPHQLALVSSRPHPRHPQLGRALQLPFRERHLDLALRRLLPRTDLLLVVEHLPRDVAHEGPLVDFLALVVA